MRLVFVLAVVLFMALGGALWVTHRGTPQSKPQTQQASAQNPFSRCAAVAAFLAKHHPKEKERDHYAAEFDIHVKFGAMFFSDGVALTSDIEKEAKIIQDGLNANPKSAGRLLDVADECMGHAAFASQRLLACIGDEPLSEKIRLECAKRAVGL